MIKSRNNICKLNYVHERKLDDMCIGVDDYYCKNFGLCVSITDGQNNETLLVVIFLWDTL